MSSPRLLFVVAPVAVIFFFLVVWSPAGRRLTSSNSVSTPRSSAGNVGQLLATERARSEPASSTAIFDAPPPSSSTLAAELNAPYGSIARDLQILSGVLTDWRLNFPHRGNPVGDNAEITAALTGNNALRLPMIPRDHPAVDPGGELHDRWGTPFRFHALAGDRMEIRSAGPDRKFGTDDDSLLTPP